MNPPRVLLAGTWDPDFHRNRALRRFLDHAGCEVAACHSKLWGERGDAVVRQGKLGLAARALLAYPLLVWRFLTSARPDVVLVPYPGHFDVPILAVLCRLRRLPLAFDIFISLHDTIVSDRRLAKPGSMLARLVGAADRLSCRYAHRVLADTPAHAEHLARLCGVPRDRFRVVPVGADGDTFRPRPEVTPDPDRVLFYGTFIPLHGVETIVRAASELEPDGIRVRLIGDGQEREAIDQLQAELMPANLERVGLVSETRLADEIAAAGICLGVFGTTEKADRVVPNKVYQCISVGRPVITGDTTAVREAFGEGEVVTVPVGDPHALAEAIRDLRRNPERRERIGAAGRRRFQVDYADEPIARRLRSHLEELGFGDVRKARSVRDRGPLR